MNKVERIISSLKPHHLNCNMFDVYDYDGLTIQELLCQFFTKLNECIEDINLNSELVTWLVEQGLELEVSKKINELLENGSFDDIFDSIMFDEIKTDLENVKNDLIKKEKVIYQVSKSGTGYPHFEYKNVINFIGDSITHGANAKDIDNQSFAGIVKKALKCKYKTTNQGFEKILLDMNNATGEMTGYHSVVNEGFEENINNNTLSLSSYISNGIGNKLYIKPKNSSKCKVFYQGGEGYGSFKFYLKSKPNDFINSSNHSNLYGQPIYSNEIKLKLGDELVIETLDNNKVEILGIQYYDNEDEFMIQNYARNGSFLVDIDDNLIPHYCSCSTLFFGFGHNDVYKASNIDLFRDKINKFIEEINNKNVYVVVNDFLWHWNSDNLFRKELKRLADETNGLYIPYSDMLYGSGNEVEWLNKGFLSDTSHPSKEGHRTIADIIIKNMGLACSDYEKRIEDVLVTSDLNVVDNVYLIDNKLIGSIVLKGSNEQLSAGEKVCKIYIPPKEQIDIYGLITQGGVECIGLVLDTNGDVTLWSDDSIYNKSAVSFSFTYEI